MKKLFCKEQLFYLFTFETMKFILSKRILALAVTSACLIFAIKMFETGFNAGQVSVKVYITVIGIIFLALGAYVGLQVSQKKTVIQYIEKEKDVQAVPNNILTERETEILKKIAEGLTNKEIGQQLFVSENTVKKHINNIYFKLDVNRRTQAIAKAKELKIIIR